jgi:hypothetical protein
VSLAVAGRQGIGCSCCNSSRQRKQTQLSVKKGRLPNEISAQEMHRAVEPPTKAVLPHRVTNRSRWSRDFARKTNVLTVNAAVELDLRAPQTRSSGLDLQAA